MIDLTPLVQATIALLGAIITAFIIPYIKSKTTTEQQQQLRTWVRIGVSAAEQVFRRSGQGEEKKEFVSDFLKAKGYHLDTETLSNLIESEVKYLWNPPVPEILIVDGNVSNEKEPEEYA